MRPTRLIGLLLTCLLTATSHATEIYKWIDEAGNTHYGDKPGAADARSLSIDPRSAGNDEALRQRQEKRDKLLEVYAEERQRTAEEQARRAAEQAARDERCQTARERLQQYRASQYLYDENEAGERRVLNDAERAAEEEKLRLFLEDQCR